MNCKIFCKDFVIKDEQLVKVENSDVSKTESYDHALSCKIETKMENGISVRKDLIKIENQNCDGFSKSEEKALMFCLESMPPKENKKRKIDSEFPEKLSNDLVNLNEEHQSEIKDLRQRLSKNALIIEKQWKEVETLRESKKKMEIKFRRSSTKIIKQLSNDLSALTESKRKMEKELNNFKAKSLNYSQQHQNVIKDLNQKLSRNALIIEKQRQELETLCKGKKKMEIEFEVLEDTMILSVPATPLV